MKKRFSSFYHHRAHKKIKIYRAEIFLLLGIFLLLSGGLVVLWGATLKVPDLNSFSERKVVQSTKIYDRTGEHLLYDVHENIRRTLVPLEDISPFVQKATVAIEDKDFFQHGGIRITSILRAILADILIKLHLSSGYTQGGSTITQQVVKNALLTQEKSFSRKIKEWALAIKFERIYDKNTILGLYLNETPYGGNLYGVEEASQSFFGKSSKDINLAESAYLAALPQAPTYFSPYGNHKDKLEERKNLVLSKMKENGFITEDEYSVAIKEKVGFLPPQVKGIHAPHFVLYVKEYLEEKYGERAVEEDGLKVTTTLDFDLEEKAEAIVERYALENKEKFNAENAGLVAIDPKTGQILVMVGSRNYFDRSIDGNFNVTLAKRQPGSSFKPFVYATAFEKGYTPDTVLFDLETEFSTGCSPEGEKLSADAVCYRPENYDHVYRGPITLRNALAQSINIPAIKTLYLAGIKDSLHTAQDMGITTLTDPGRYGLTLVLGGGEVTLLDMTSAYGVFAMEGIRNPPVPILKVENSRGEVLEEYTPKPSTALPENIARMISDILSDNEARTPAFGANSALYFPGKDVADKTGTTNDYRDAWVVGYTPNFVAGAWAGNNDNSPMEKRVAGFIVAPLWHEFMVAALNKIPEERFTSPEYPDPQSLKPVLRGIWQGGEVYAIDKATNSQATSATPEERKVERVIPNVHSILYWVDKNNPLGPAPLNPNSDPQFRLWEPPVRAWAEKNNLQP